MLSCCHFLRMNDPWKILGLNLEGVTAGEVKSAYARLLKIHRPEADPEGFRRIRDAYEGATAELQALPSPATTSEEPQASPEIARNAPEPASPPEANDQFRLVTGRLRGAVCSRTRQKIREALGELDAAAEASGAGADAVAGAIFAAFSDHPSLLAEMCPDQRLLAQLGRGETQLIHTVVQLWNREGEVRRLETFAGKLRRHPASTACGLVLVHVAVAVAAWNPALAGELANVAFAILPSDQRESMMPEIENEIALGRIFEGFPADHRRFWLGHIRGAGQQTNWRDKWSRELLQFVMMRCGGGWAGFGVLQKTMSRGEWDHLVHALKMYFS